MTQFSTLNDQRLTQFDGPFSRQVPVSLTQTDWHAAISGGAPLNVTTAFVNPSASEISRVPRIITAGGGATIQVTLVGTYNGAAQTETVTCLTNSTTDATLPFDTVTSLTTDVDPVSDTTLRWGRSYFDPAPCALQVGAAGNINCRLLNNSAFSVVAGVPIGDWRRRVRLVDPTSTTATGLVALYP